MNVRIADTMNNTKTLAKTKLPELNESNAKNLVPCSVTHKFKRKMNPPESAVAINKYIDCIL